MYTLVSAVLLFVILGVIVLFFALAGRGESERTRAAPLLPTTEHFSEGVVVVSMTTSPQRLPLIAEALDSLYERQTRKPDYVVLNLPHVFKRNGGTYDLQQFPYLNKPHIILNRCEDIGPITKLVPTLELLKDFPNAKIIVADDDIEYPPRLVEALLEGAEKQPDAVVTAWCLGGYYTHPTSKCGIVEGYQSFLVKPKLFGPDFQEYLSVALKNEDCFKSDDYVLSSFIHGRGIPVFVLAGADIGGRVRPVEYGLQDDALHKQIDTQHHERYCSCFRYLKDAGLDTPLPTRCPGDDVAQAEAGSGVA